MRIVYALRLAKEGYGVQLADKRGAGGFDVALESWPDIAEWLAQHVGD